jgi:hypothetical protein
MAICLLGAQPLLLGGLARLGLGDLRVLLDARGLRASEVGQVVALGLDVLQLERVEREPLVGERGLGLLGDRRGERRPVLDDLLDGEATDDGAQLPRGPPGEGLDLRCWVRNRCAAARIASSLPPTLTIATPSRSALMPWVDTAPRIADGDPPARQVHDVQLLHEGQDEDARAHDDLLAAHVVETSPVSGFFTGEPLRPVMM